MSPARRPGIAPRAVRAVPPLAAAEGAGGGATVLSAPGLTGRSPGFWAHLDSETSPGVYALTEAKVAAGSWTTPGDARAGTAPEVNGLTGLAGKRVRVPGLGADYRFVYRRAGVGGGGGPCGGDCVPPFLAAGWTTAGRLTLTDDLGAKASLGWVGGPPACQCLAAWCRTVQVPGMNNCTLPRTDATVTLTVTHSLQCVDGKLHYSAGYTTDTGVDDASQPGGIYWYVGGGPTPNSTPALCCYTQSEFSLPPGPFQQISGYCEDDPYGGSLPPGTFCFHGQHAYGVGVTAVLDMPSVLNPFSLSVPGFGVVGAGTITGPT